MRSVACVLLILICTVYLGTIHGSVVAASTTFSFVWMADTQHYSESYPATYDAIALWIVKNKDAMGIRYVIHTGDIVENARNLSQWNNANHSMRIMEAANVTYGILGGNHDGGDGFLNYHAYFGSQRFKTDLYYDNYPAGNNDDHYDLITANGLKFVVVCLSYHVDRAEMAWASNVFSTHPDRIGILAVHQYLKNDGSYDGDGAALNANIVLPNRNVWLVICGHNHGAQLNVKTAGSRTYYELISDYQDLENGGKGFIKIFTFDSILNRVHVTTYSTSFNQYGGTSYSYDQFDLTLPSVR